LGRGLDSRGVATQLREGSGGRASPQASGSEAQRLPAMEQPRKAVVVTGTWRPGTTGRAGEGRGWCPQVSQVGKMSPPAGARSVGATQEVVGWRLGCGTCPRDGGDTHLLLPLSRSACPLPSSPELRAGSVSAPCINGGIVATHPRGRTGPEVLWTPAVPAMSSSAGLWLAEPGVTSSPETSCPCKPRATWSTSARPGSGGHFVLLSVCRGQVREVSKSCNRCCDPARWGWSRHSQESGNSPPSVPQHLPRRCVQLWGPRPRRHPQLLVISGRGLRPQRSPCL
jgi:hypothetical protein